MFLQNSKLLLSKLKTGLRNPRFLSSDSLKKTCLHDFHVKHGGKMVDFAGYSMPVQYADLGITASHIHTRKSSSIFDVSHMLQSEIRGKHAIEFIESLTCADVQGLKDNQGTLSVFTNDHGGILDDLIVSKINPTFLYMVTNAGCRHSDIPLLMNKLDAFKKDGKDVHLELCDNKGLIALQGPKSAQVLQKLVENSDLSKLLFMNTTTDTVAGVPNCRITRCGYTGEDGFEISIPTDKCTDVTEALLNNEEVKLAGLGARDSLRLEAGLCLYGNDIDETTTPIEAGLTFVVGKRRRETADFPGAEVILRQIKEKPKKKRVGISYEGGPPARSSAGILNPETGAKMGQVTSGGPSQSIPGVNIAIGYVESGFSKSGSLVKLSIRKREMDAKVTKMPFVKANYYFG